jgi:hypothetical protein
VKDINNIDELLKERMQDFTPDVPADVWTQISSNMSYGENPSGFQIIKSLSVGVKSAIFIIAASLATGLYFIVISDNQSSVEFEQKANVELIDKSNSTQISPIESIAVNPSENKIESVPQTKTQSGRFKEHNLDKIIETQATLENPVSVKIELPLKQDITAPKTEMLVSKDTKTETVEGNPETESGDNNLSDEVKLPEPEIKKDYPVVNNAISPDGDGLNDELVIEMPAVDFYHLRIFTKKGVLVFETENVNVKWKGLVLGSGQYADNGEYRYILEYQIKGKENVKVIGGYIFLSR